MTRHVFTGDRIAHEWVRAPLDSTGRTGNGSQHWSSDGFYSYQTRIATRITSPVTGESAYLVCIDKYTPTTTRHQWALQSAIGLRPHFYVVASVDGYGTPDAFRIVEEQLRDAERLTARARRRRFEGYCTGDLQAADDAAQTARQFAAFMGIDIGADRTAMLARAHTLANEAREARRASEAERERLANERWRAELAAAVPRWIAGEKISLAGHPDTFLRASGRHEVQTSRGAIVSYATAERLYRALASRQLAHGADADGYTVVSVTDESVQIGCHHISRAEIERFAASQGWTNERSDVAAA